MRKIPLEKHKERIKFLYSEKGLSLKDVAKETGVCPATIRNNMIAWKMPRRETKKRELVKPTKKELEEFYITKKLPMENISKTLGVALSTVFRWLNEYKIPIRRFRYQKYDFSEDTREKAYILGLVTGDLSVSKHCRQILVELSTTHPAMADLFYSVFQKYGTVKKYLKYNKITKRYGWRLYSHLNDSFNFMLSENFDIDNAYFYDFLAGFFDCEGCFFIYNNKGYTGLSALIYNSNKKLLDIIKSKLERDGFHPKLSKYFKKNTKTSNGYYRKCDLWAIRLHTIKEVLSLMSLMPIKHKEKLDKVNIAMSQESNKWEKVSEQVINLRMDIKNEVKEYINPLNMGLK